MTFWCQNKITIRSNLHHFSILNSQFPNVTSLDFKIIILNNFEFSFKSSTHIIMFFQECFLSGCILIKSHVYANFVQTGTEASGNPAYNYIVSDPRFIQCRDRLAECVRSNVAQLLDGTMNIGNVEATKWKHTLRRQRGAQLFFLFCRRRAEIFFQIAL